MNSIPDGEEKGSKELQNDNKYEEKIYMVRIQW